MHEPLHDSALSPVPARERMDRVFQDKQKDSEQNPDFRAHTIQEKREKQRMIEKCVRLGLAVDQMEFVLPNFGVHLKKRAIYNYLSDIKLPRNYCKSSGQQSTHDYMVSWVLVEIVRAFNQKEITVDTILTNAAPDGERFRPDIELWANGRRYFVEVQLSGIANTRWKVKHRNYLRLYEKSDHPFRVLFIIDQKGEMAYVRRGGRDVLKDHPNLNLYYYATLQTIRSGDFVDKQVWRTAKGEYISLLD